MHNLVGIQLQLINLIIIIIVVNQYFFIRFSDSRSRFVFEFFIQSLDMQKCKVRLFHCLVPQQLFRFPTPSETPGPDNSQVFPREQPLRPHSVLRRWQTRAISMSSQSYICQPQIYNSNNSHNPYSLQPRSSRPGPSRGRPPRPSAPSGRRRSPGRTTSTAPPSTFPSRPSSSSRPSPLPDPCHGSPPSSSSVEASVSTSP